MYLLLFNEIVFHYKVLFSFAGNVDYTGNHFFGIGILVPMLIYVTVGIS